MSYTRQDLAAMGEIALGIERIGAHALAAGAEAHALRMAMIEAVADLQSALGRLKAALAESARQLDAGQ